MTPPPLSSTLVGQATIIRSIMTYNHIVAVADAVPSRIGIGVTIMTNDGFVALAPPDPLSDSSQSWYYWMLRDFRVAQTVNINDQWSADIRSARRLRGGFKLVLVVETDAATHIAASTFRATMRNLWRVD